MNYHKNAAIGLSVLIVVFTGLIFFYYRYDYNKDFPYFLIFLLVVYATLILYLRTLYSKHKLEIKVKELKVKLSKTNNKIKELNIESEQRIKKRTERLERKNQELESFYFSLSHDLRAPLRAIEGFTQILIEDYYNIFDDKGKDNVKRICKGSKKLLYIIDEMLKLANIIKKEICIQDVNLSTIAKEYTDLIIEKNSKSKNNVKFLIAPDLTARGDYGLLDTAISNILNNAVIEFNTNNILNGGNSTDLQKNVFFIKDNGIGFDMKYADTIFDAFKRPHKSDDFDGTGIGLATVKQIIDRHGGKIWVESQHNIGTTVYFTLG